MTPTVIRLWKILIETNTVDTYMYMYITFHFIELKF